MVLVAILVAGVLVSGVLACRSVLNPKGGLTGEDLKEHVQQGREGFARLDGPKTMRFLSPEKAQMMQNLNPNLLSRELEALYHFRIVGAGLKPAPTVVTII